ncbi:C4-dicarboxylate like transporter [Vibrio maritimus]|uniref:C4-dicarboxylate like transporter n=1 Tax=Vibrio maritimus TaxID=990268 RepID=A0A090TYH1_9VIBR|nr:C4-dicarboxylate like transporter [Vibrio maritimus]
MFYVHMLLLLAVIFVGIRYGGIAFGLLGGLGVSILSFFFGIAPGTLLLALCSSFLQLLRPQQHLKQQAA